MKKIVFLTRALEAGGAQRQLINLGKALDRKGFEVAIIVFYSGGRLEVEIKDSSIKLITLEKKGRWDILSFVKNLVVCVRRLQPTVLHSYLSTANLLALLIKIFHPSIAIVWGIRASNINLDYYDWLTGLTFKIERWLSQYADLIIINSYAGRDFHAALGFPSEKMIVIPNGIDTKRFCLNRESRLTVREEWQISEEVIVVGLVGRLDPMKDHSTFLEAAAILAQARSDVYFVCVGSGGLDYAQTLHALGNSLGLSDRLIWVEARRDIEAVYNAIDIMTSASAYGEGFSNVIAEAMACEVPCVVTDVGDSAIIVGDTGIVVPPRDPAALSAAWQRILKDEEYRRKLGQKARQRIIEHYTIDHLLKSTITALNCLMSSQIGSA